MSSAVETCRRALISAEAVLGHDPSALVERLPPKPKAVNDAVWQIFALRQSNRTVPRALVTYVKGAQARSGGFPWAKGVSPDSNVMWHWWPTGLRDVVSLDTNEPG